MLVSLHGGHSGEFCNHASDTLEDMILKYIELGFTHVGISEHMPPIDENLMYDDEKDANLSPDLLFDRFDSYIKKCKSLKYKYKNTINIYTGFETETYEGYEKYVPSLIKRFRPDYIVGSVHHINGLCFDSSQDHYKRAVATCTDIVDFYNLYFDIQYEMFLNIRPQVAGHFDLVRIFDEDYKSRIREKSVARRIERNLEVMKEYNIILDYNQRALMKNMKEPYPEESILDKAVSMGIHIVPGDDSHDVKTVGYNFEEANNILESKGKVLTEDIFVNFF